MNIEKRIHLYQCPLCGEEYLCRLLENIHRNLSVTFPTTYGNGLLICDHCLPARLQEIKDNAAM